MRLLFLIALITNLSGAEVEKKFTMKQVAEHTTAKDCWIVIKEKVYDISPYIPKHPAPEAVLTKYCGKYADVGWETKDKNNKHSRSAERLLKRYKIGIVSH